MPARKSLVQQRRGFQPPQVSNSPVGPFTFEDLHQLRKAPKVKKGGSQEWPARMGYILSSRKQCLLQGVANDARTVLCRQRVS